MIYKSIRWNKDIWMNSVIVHRGLMFYTWKVLRNQERRYGKGIFRQFRKQVHRLVVLWMKAPMTHEEVSGHHTIKLDTWCYLFFFISLNLLGRGWIPFSTYFIIYKTSLLCNKIILKNFFIHIYFIIFILFIYNKYY